MNRFRNWLLKHIFNAVVIDDIVSFEGRGTKFLVKINGITLTDQELRSLREESRYLVNTRIWKLITSTLADDAKQRMFEKSKNFDDMVAGKMALYTVDMQNKMVDIIANRSSFDSK